MNDLRSSSNEPSRVLGRGESGAEGALRPNRSAGGLMVALAVALVAGLALLANAGSASAAIPSGFFVVPDQQGVNDVNADQSDLSQMGRDDDDPAFYKLFWSWDSTSLWTGVGQTGDACALFDADGDGNVDYAACARITNPDANPAQATLTADSPFLFSCTDARDDRCSQPTPLLATGIQAGTIGSGGLDRSGNLITDTDPFAPAGSNSPSDVTLQINIPKLLIANAVLVNVCSYPSAGNGGNNNPFDCIANPGSGYLVIVKDAGADTTTSFPFAVTPVPAGTSSSYTIVGSGQTGPISTLVGNATETVTETVPAGWRLSTASCLIAGNGATGTFDAANSRVTGISIESGLETVCTFVNVEDNPSLGLQKSASPSSYDSVGDLISYGYLVTNTGNVRLAGPVTVADDKATVSCPALSTVGNGDGFLDPGEAVTCTASYAVTQADLNSGSVTNVATASADGVDSNQDTETVTAVQSTSLSLVKSASPSSYDAVGDLISYGYLVTNAGNVRLAGPVTVADDKATVTCPALSTVGNGDGFLDPREAVTCTASYAITQADLNSGSVTNVATASTDGVDSNEDQATVEAVQDRELALEKTAAPLSYAAAGDVISYSYAVTNTGNVRLAGPVTVADDKATVTCPAVTTVGNGDGFLDPGEAVTCSASYSITQSDLNAGSVTNVAKASADGVDSNQDTETVTAVQRTSLGLVKSASPSSYDLVGDVISYGYLVTNTGNVRLAGPVTVADDKATVTCPAVTTVGNGDGFLDPREAVTCTASYAITQADLNSGSVTNTAKASADGVDSNEDQATVEAVQDRELALEKTAAPLSYAAAGDVISYSYAVTNTGNVRLAGPVTVADDKATVSCPALSTVGNNDGFLDPGEAVTCTASYSITQADVNNGSVTNVAKARAGGVDSPEDTATVTATPPPPPPPPPTPPAPPAPPVAVAAPAAPVIDLSITKTDRPDPVFVGARLVYTLTVRNGGPDTATNVRVVDALPAATAFLSVSTTQGSCRGGRVVRCNLGSLAVGGRAIVTIVVRPTEPGALLNGATVVGDEPEPNTANNQAFTPTLVRGPFRPPAAACPTLTVQQRSLSVGKRGVIRALVTEKGRGVRGVRILVTGPGLRKSALTDTRGRVAISVRPPRAGIAEIRMTNRPARCSTRRVGVVGVFEPPSVTG